MAFQKLSTENNSSVRYRDYRECFAMFLAWYSRLAYLLKQPVLNCLFSSSPNKARNPALMYI
ncbi:hypothetical protein CHS0354_011678 [Potamilus streckersoni]|uniref:Uncharacterized protein n=1 Tax=Potamilus streckersoni TaxID=2493646 RepID=A0AAE0RRU1_9BIVA|nr:hypothetical protein CHS0354_011678 [Potamilus streckersoni]